MDDPVSAEDEENCATCGLPLSVPPYFICPNFHTTCIQCYRQSAYSEDECTSCNGTRYYSYLLEEYDRLASRQKVFTIAKNCPAVVLVPTSSSEEDNILYTETVNPQHAELNKQYRLHHCPDCKKCVSTQSVMEHFLYEHGGVPLLPLRPGHLVAFTFQSDQIKLGQIRLLYVLRLFNSTKCDGEERLLYVLCSKSPLLGQTGTMTLAFWLASSFNGCCLHYTMEFRADSGMIASSMFTGPVLANTENENIILGKAKVEEVGPFFSIKESLIRSLVEEGGGALVKVLVHDELTFG